MTGKLPDSKGINEIFSKMARDNEREIINGETNLSARLESLYSTAAENYKISQSDYDAGVLEGLKRALEAI